MEQIVYSFSALAVAAIYYTHRAFLAHCHQRQRTLRERVAYMLWVTANTAR